MKTITITRETICNNLKNNYKAAVIIFALCLIIGVVTGAYQARSYEPESFVVNVDINSPVYLTDYPESEHQIYDLYNSIKTNADCLETYYQYLMHISVSEESRVIIEQAADDYNDFYYRDILEFTDSFTDAPAAAEGYLLETKDYYRQKAEDYDEFIESDTLRLEDVLNGAYSQNYKETFQGRIEPSIARNRKVSESLKKIASGLEGLSDSELQKNREAFYNQAEYLSKRVNEEGAILDELLRDLASKENYELMYNKYLLPDAAFGDINEEVMSDRLGEAILYARSVEGIDKKKERFCASVLFFVMFGVTISILFGALHEKKPKNNS